jgi:hypothetical protein
MRLPTVPFVMRPPIQNVPANPNDCRLQSSRRSIGLWRQGWPRYGREFPDCSLRQSLLNVEQRLGHLARPPTHPQCVRAPHFDPQASTLGLPLLTPKLLRIHAILGTSANTPRLHIAAAGTDCRSACRIEAGYRCRLAGICPAVSRSSRLLLQPDRVADTKRPVPKSRGAAVCCCGVRRSRIRPL